MNNFKSGKINFYPMNLATSTVAAGAAGYVDTDVSAITGTDTAKWWLVACKTNLQIVGARTHGATTDNKFTAYEYVIWVKVDSSGHLDLYRNAVSDAYYNFLGYFL